MTDRQDVPAVDGVALDGTRLPDADIDVEELLTSVVDLLQGLAANVDTVELLQVLVGRFTDLFAPSFVGVIVADERGDPAILAASSSEAQELEALQLDTGRGPCLEALGASTTVAVDDLERESDRWPGWADHAAALGARSTYSLPMSADGAAYGTVNLFGTRPGLLGERDIRVAELLADAASAVVLTNRQARRAEQLTTQLQNALDSRIVIEQAKGVVATALGIGIDDAFVVLRHYTRSTHQRLVEVATAITTGRLGADQLDARRR